MVWFASCKPWTADSNDNRKVANIPSKIYLDVRKERPGIGCSCGSVVCKRRDLEEGNKAPSLVISSFALILVKHRDIISSIWFDRTCTSMDNTDKSCQVSVSCNSSLSDNGCVHSTWFGDRVLLLKRQTFWIQLSILQTWKQFEWRENGGVIYGMLWYGGKCKCWNEWRLWATQTTQMGEDCCESLVSESAVLCPFHQYTEYLGPLIHCTGIPRPSWLLVEIFRLLRFLT